VLRRHFAAIGLAVTLILSLTGCMHMDRSVALNSDGTGTYTLAIGFSEQMVAMASDQLSTSMDQYGAKVKQQGGSYRHYDDTGYSYWAFTRPFKSVADLNSLVKQTPDMGANLPGSSGLPGVSATPDLSNLPGFGATPDLSNLPGFGGTPGIIGTPDTSAGSGIGSNPFGSLPSSSSLPVSSGQDTLAFSEQSGFLTNSFHVTGHMSMAATPGVATNTGGIDLTPLLKDMRETFSITMPGSITSHKGGVVDGNTVTYTVHYGEQTDIDVVGGGLNTALLLPIGGVVLLVVLALIGFFIWRSRRGKRVEQGEAREPALVAAAHDAPTVPEFSAQPPHASGDAPTHE
jgi:hypothetical protein